MFSSLTENLNGIFNKLRGKGHLTEKDVDEALREVRVALFQADVALEVVRKFLDRIKQKAIGLELIKSVNPAHQVIKIVSDEIEELLKSENAELNLKVASPAVVLMVGLQGSGKTTSSAKLAAYLRKHGKKKALLASLDVYRPAAQLQLESLAKQLAIDSLEIIKDEKVVDIAKRAVAEARRGLFDVLILDSAGRLESDAQLISELQHVKDVTNPVETILVADSMTGQIALNVAKEFNEKVGITGLILTRLDGDSRGGVALSMKEAIGVPIKFVGIGEKTSDFEQFHADRMASRILGMGDIVGLVERASEAISEAEVASLKTKFRKGTFNFHDLLSQLQNIGKMGGVSKLIGMVPGMGAMKEKLANAQGAEGQVKKQIAIIQSMTYEERTFPHLINASRKKRIAQGSGTRVELVNRLLKQMQTMSNMMKQFSGMNEKDMEKMQRMLNAKLK